MDLSFIPDNVCRLIERIRNCECQVNEKDEYQLPGVKIYASQVESVLQIGPQCGLVALKMAGQYLKASEVSIEVIEEKAKALGFTRHGEIFSAQWLAQLNQEVYPNLKAIDIPFPNSNEMANYLLAGRTILVPYDCDRNHEPVLKNGHKSHWAIIVGFVITSFECEEIEAMGESLSEQDLTRPLHLLVQHGKSKYMAIWRYGELSRSNAQLNESGPDRPEEDYIIPAGGMQLKSRCVLISKL